MKESKAPYIILLIFLAGLIALYINLDNQPRAEPTPNLKEQFSIDAERESLRESYEQEQQAEVETLQIETVKVQPIADDDFELMCRIVMNEAGGESYRCQVAVAETILNRVASDDFPDTIYDVIYQPYQYSHNENGEITDSVREAVWQAFEYHIFDENMVYFRTEYYHQFEDAEDYMLIDNTYFSIKK